jgi:hypothetical protein
MGHFGYARCGRRPSASCRYGIPGGLLVSWALDKSPPAVVSYRTFATNRSVRIFRPCRGGAPASDDLSSFQVVACVGARGADPGNVCPVGPRVRDRALQYAGDRSERWRGRAPCAECSPRGRSGSQMPRAGTGHQESCRPGLHLPQRMRDAGLCSGPLRRATAAGDAVRERLAMRFRILQRRGLLRRRLQRGLCKL